MVLHVVVSVENERLPPDPASRSRIRSHGVGVAAEGALDLGRNARQAQIPQFRTQFRQSGSRELGDQIGGFGAEDAGVCSPLA
jgi:hypothetical protein